MKGSLALLLLPVLGLAQSNSTVQLVPFTFTPLPLGSIKPQGWLKDQMQLMADGLAGHEMDFYPYVSDSVWLGGDSTYSDLNEGLPYWFNGLVGLAYGLGDETLINQVLNATSYVLAHQQDSGWIGPETTYNSNNLWARFPLSLGLMQMAQANSSLTDQIVDALYKFVVLMDGMLEDGQSDSEQWGRARYADMNIVLQWLYEHHPNDNSSVLIETMSRWRQHGVDWAGYYTQQSYLFNDINSYPDDLTNAEFPFLHGVNVMQGLKTMAVDYRFTSNQSLIQTSKDAVNWTFMYHGSPSGSVLGDERETSLQPQHGTELCAVVETMFSMTYMYHLLGDPSLADRAELVAFNAMPTMLTPDHWAHQYIAQPNQAFANVVPDVTGLWWNTDNVSITYGVDPDYPCCAVNHPQGWQKLLQASFASAGNNGLAHTVLAPAVVNTTLGDGTQVGVSCDTSYPFTPVLNYDITSSGPFTLYLRVPGWNSDAPQISLNGKSVDASSPDDHAMVAVQVPSGSSSITYTLNPSIELEHRGNNTVAVHHGALLYAIDLGQMTQTVAPVVAGAPSSASSVYYNNTSPWNLAINTSTLTYVGPTAGNSSVTLANPIFEYQAPPSYITADSCQIDWPLFQGVAGPVPLDGNRTCTADAAQITMRPYGSLRARMVELPLMGT